MSNADEPRAVVAKLSRDECFSLLISQPVGRLAVTVPGEAPLVVPVNYVLDGEIIVFRSDPGTKMRLLAGGPVSFQVDFVDWHHRSGWSVLVAGSASDATDDDVAHLRLEPWAEGDKRHWVRIVADSVTGRRLEHVELPWPGRDRGYL